MLVPRGHKPAQLFACLLSYWRVQVFSTISEVLAKVDEEASLQTAESLPEPTVSCLLFVLPACLPACPLVALYFIIFSS